MKLIGLTGGIATGKSTVSRLLTEQGLPIIDADKIAREIVEPGRKANQLIRQHFGDEVFLPDGYLDRPKLGQIIFQDPEKRKILNHCTHPYVRWEMAKQAFLYWLRGADIVIFDVPLLIENANTSILMLSSSDILQLQRLRKRDNLTEEQAIQRMKSQMPMSEKVEKADIVLDNSSDIQQLEIQVRNMVKKIKPSRLTWFFEYAGPPVAIALLSVIAKRYAPILLNTIGDSIASLK
ncbi:hypothetical protein INT47_010219 [Mucor saturninus]|uniref:Dephospho-CoA kinase n=1 Tax=Mucor saturninus TaxID=64648 RepID=A0A8H7V9N0_9FUNG|nr:hypothetical protein INT47_010219 [Mucor saturninus]